jgi:NADPH:quinone reductase-like Zn-dependent oxidoreductase
MAQGASSVIGRDDIGDKLDRVLGSERWDGAIDCVGGETLKQILRTLRYNASVAVSGLLGGGELNGTIYPFITRGVSLLGIDTVEATTATRIKVWNELGASIAQLPIESLTDRVISLTAIPQALSDVRSGATRGRIVVRPRND